MTASNTDLLKKYLSLFSTTLSTGIGTGTGDTITPASVSGLATDTAVTLTIDRVDSGGVATPTKMERIKGVISGGNLTSYVRGVDGTTEQAHSAGAVVEMVWNADDWNNMVDWGLVSHNQDGSIGASKVVASNISASAVTAGKLAASSVVAGNLAASVMATSAEITTGTEDAKIVTPKGLKDAGIVANSGILTTSQYAPQGFLINGKIVPSVASNNLTVAIKGMDGNDPSASNPVYVRIGDTVRTLTAALSVTKNAGTNWFNAGATELATKEIDYFVYLGYNTTDGVVIGFGRIPSANEYGDFSTTSTNEKYCAISTTTNAVSGDDYELVGRFAATLSAGAGYTWSVPTFTNKNLIQRPIYETRFLNYVPTLTWSAGVAPSGSPGINTHTYKITYNNMHVSNFVDGYSAGTSVTRVQITTPILPSGYFVNSGQITVSDTPNATTGYVASGGVMNLFCTSVAATRFTNTALFSI